MSPLPDTLGGKSLSHQRGRGSGRAFRLPHKPRTTHQAVACLCVALVLACDVTSPDRSDSYGFRLLPENTVFRWPAERLPVRYFASPVGALPDYVRSGLLAWESQFLYGEFDGEVTTDSAGADVRVVIEGGTPPAATLTNDPAVSACDGVTSATLADATHLAAPLVIRVRWFPSFAARDVANCLSRVTAHEIGHSMGLLQHSNDPADLMFGVPAVRDPSARDRSTAELLYHTAPDLQPAPRP
jgi:hypothetical protein